MGSFSIWHWLIVLVVVVLIFGTKKLGNIGKDLGEGIKGFKQGLKGDETPPAQLGPVVPGDVMHMTMEGLGEMTVQVRGGPGRKTPMDGMEPDQPAT